MKNYLIILVLALAIISCNQKVKVEEKTQTVAQSGAMLKIIYFHGENRCSSCQKIETLTDNYINSNLKPMIQAGKVSWEKINYDKPENAHYNDDYKLFNQTLTLVKFKDGKQVEYKNCEKIWELYGNEPDFNKYIAEEINSYLKGI